LCKDFVSILIVLANVVKSFSLSLLVQLRTELEDSPAEVQLLLHNMLEVLMIFKIEKHSFKGCHLYEFFSNLAIYFTSNFGLRVHKGSFNVP
jgi:hypothetical protein